MTKFISQMNFGVKALPILWLAKTTQEDKMMIKIVTVLEDFNLFNDYNPPRQ